MQGFFTELSSLNSSGLSGGSCGVTEETSGLSIPLSLDLTAANKELNTFKTSAQKAVKLTADASGVVSAGSAALSTLQSLFASTTLSISAVVSTSASVAGSAVRGVSSGLSAITSLLKSSSGGRFDRPTATEVAEDGDPEYVIPVKKESLAVPLLRQLLGELSDSARETLLSGFSGKTNGEESLSGLPDTLSSAASAAAPVIQQTSNASVQAPVSIQVTAAGTDPEAVGRSIYDVTKQYLLRTLKNAAG